MSAQRQLRDDGYANGYVRCSCGSKNVSLFSIRSKPVYENGRRVREGGRVIGVQANCHDCKASERHVPALANAEGRP